MQDYTIHFKFGAADDRDAWRFGKKLRTALDAGIASTGLDASDRSLVMQGPTAMFLTRREVARAVKASARQGTVS